MATQVIGVLALQGAYLKHMHLLQALRVDTRVVRTADDLDHCTALIIPGGESTVMSRIIRDYQLTAALQDFSAKHPVLGTCAGLVLMARHSGDARVQHLSILNCRIQRNVHGSHYESFSTDLRLDFDSEGPQFNAIFIRAPGIEQLGADIEILAEHQGKAVLIAQGHHMACAFHPELTFDTRIHCHWLSWFNA